MHDPAPERPRRRLEEHIAFHRGLATATGEQALPSLLQQVTARLEALGDEFEADRGAVAALTRRLEEGRFHLAVLGQFKRGKSTLLNALLGEEVLPASVVPLTALPTFIRPGGERRARICFEDGTPAETLVASDAGTLSAFLSRYVTEVANPHNRLGVSHVEVFHPAPLLHRGVVLIDTPGIGSTHRHNTETTRAFLPQCDAALFLVSADPPITQVELDFLREVRSHVPHLFFALNKADILRRPERAAAVGFLKQVLREAGWEAPRLFCVSAHEALGSREAGDAAGWQASGMAEVERYLIDFLATEKASVLQQAVAGKAAARLEETLLRLGITLRSLEMPVVDLEERLRIFEEKIEEAEQQRVVAADLLAGDQKRLLAFLDEQAQALRLKAQAHLEAVVEETTGATDAVDEAQVQAALAEAIPAFFARELAETARTFDRRVTEVLRPHQQRADALIDAVRRQAAELFDVPYHAPESEGAFIAEREPYWVTQRWNTTMLAGAGSALERLLPASMQHGRIKKRLRDQIEALALTNMGNLHWATLQNLDLTFRRFRARLDERLTETARATRGAIQAALHRRTQQAASVAGAVDRLRTARAGLAAIQDRLNAFSDERYDRSYLHQQKNEHATNDIDP